MSFFRACSDPEVETVKKDESSDKGMYTHAFDDDDEDDEMQYIFHEQCSDDYLDRHTILSL